MAYEAYFSLNILENSENEILLLKRSYDVELGPGLWGFSAGHIEKDETPQACSERELKEEIGDKHSIYLVNHIGPLTDSFYGGKYQVFLFHYRWRNGNIKLNPEHTDYVWVSKENFKNYPVMDGIDEDIFYLKIWPIKYLNKNKLPIK